MFFCVLVFIFEVGVVGSDGWEVSVGIGFWVNIGRFIVSVFLGSFEFSFKVFR